MSRKWILIVGIVLIVASLAGFIFRSNFKSAQAGIHIETTPQAAVFIDDQQVGITPYDGVRDAGEVTLKLVPQVQSNPYPVWETKITLTAGIKTVVKREFGATEAESSGEVLSFEKLSSSTASLTVVSTPDAAQVALDGEIRGFTPLPINSATEGDHKILVTQPGFNLREIQARTYAGYKLTVITFLSQAAQQAQAQDASMSAVLGEEVIKKTMVEILDTPTGFLRVRSAPDKNATESAQLKSGDKVPYLDQNDKGDWFKVEYEIAKEGWISSQYAKKIEE